MNANWRSGMRQSREIRAMATGWRAALPYAAASMAPIPLLVAAATLGGGWSLAALLWMSIGVHLADTVLARIGPAARSEDIARATGDRISVALAIAHFVLMAVAVWSLGGAGPLGPWDGLATFLAFGLWFGQVSNANAHELIHRRERWLFRLGWAVFVSLLYGHHVSAHRLVHHRFVATPDDPNTARAGEGFYRFLTRAWPGAFLAGYEMERNLRRRARGPGRLNPYAIHVGGALALLVLVTWLFGADGLVAYLLLCAHAQIQILLSDYVQHYGLLRRQLPDGRPEPVGPAHSWDAPRGLSGLMMLNAPRHADHHMHPAKGFGELESPAQSPRLPASLPIMATIALIPPLWRHVMDRRLRRMASA